MVCSLPWLLFIPDVGRAGFIEVRFSWIIEGEPFLIFAGSDGSSAKLHPLPLLNDSKLKIFRGIPKESSKKSHPFPIRRAHCIRVRNNAVTRRADLEMPDFGRSTGTLQGPAFPASGTSDGTCQNNRRNPSQPNMEQVLKRWHRHSCLWAETELSRHRQECHKRPKVQQGMGIDMELHHGIS